MRAYVRGILHSEFFDKLHTLVHKMNSVKSFRCKMLSYGSQLEENDSKHPDAPLCMEKTDLLPCYHDVFGSIVVLFMRAFRSRADSQICKENMKKKCKSNLPKQK